MKKFIIFAFMGTVLAGAHLISATSARAENLGQQLIEGKCSACHKFDGKAESRFNLKAPDLMWGGASFRGIGWFDTLQVRKTFSTRKVTDGINLERPPNI
ncbi:MAG: hypothetical protein ACQ9MH_11795 [Nitrospinales bacterium]